MSARLNIANRFTATRPRHLMGNDPRKLVSHYETTTHGMSIAKAVIFGLALGFILAAIMGAL